MSTEKDHIFEIEELRLSSRGGIVRLPELVGVPFTSRVKAVVDHPHFQRLRKVRQLSLTYLVFPGATHTRFEHSLGVFENTTRYLVALLTDPRQDYLRKNTSRSEIDSLLLASLLHDIGHYPFAHLLEDLYGQIADHEELVEPLLTGAAVEMFDSLKRDHRNGSLAETIKKHWGLDDIRDICFFISGKGGEHYSDDELKHKKLLRSILSGPVDTDKMDYLYRDSIHCGVPYGRFIDRDRFFQALTIDSERGDSIAVTEKGRIVIELFAYARSAMFSEVYWHHSARSITSMLNRAIAEATNGRGGILAEEILSQVFARSDEEAVDWLYDNGTEATRSILGLLRQRRLYKRLLVLESQNNPRLHQMLDRIKWDQEHSFEDFMDSFSEAVIKDGSLSRACGKEIGPLDLLMDVPIKKTGLGDLPIIPEHSKRYSKSSDASQVLAGIGSDFERWVRKIRLFMHPELQESLKRNTSSKLPDEQLQRHLVKLLEDCAARFIEK